MMLGLKKSYIMKHLGTHTDFACFADVGNIDVKHVRRADVNENPNVHGGMLNM